MKINISKRDYETIIKALDISEAVFGSLTDFVSESYREEYEGAKKAMSNLLKHSKDFKLDKIVEEYEGELFLSDLNPDFALNVLGEYVDLEIYQKLSNQLAWRDFRIKYSDEEIKKMDKSGTGYYGVELYPFEKRY